MNHKYSTVTVIFIIILFGVTAVIGTVGDIWTDEDVADTISQINVSKRVCVGAVCDPSWQLSIHNNGSINGSPICTQDNGYCAGQPAQGNGSAGFLAEWVNGTTITHSDWATGTGDLVSPGSFWTSSNGNRLNIRGTAGGSNIWLSIGIAGTGYYNFATDGFSALYGRDIRVGSTTDFQFDSAANGAGGTDAAITRNKAGWINVTQGTDGTYGNLSAGSIFSDGNQVCTAPNGLCGDGHAHDQDLNTTSNTQFNNTNFTGRIAVGDSYVGEGYGGTPMYVNIDSRLDVTEMNDYTYYILDYRELNLEPDAAATGDAFGLNYEINIPSTSTEDIDDVYGLYLEIDNDGTGAADTIDGIQIALSNKQSATDTERAIVNTYYGEAASSLNAYTGYISYGWFPNVADVHHMYLAGAFVDFPTDNHYGLRIGDIQGATLNRAILTEGGTVEHRSGSATVTPLKLTADPGQTAPMLDVVDSADNSMVVIDEKGWIGVGDSDPNYMLSGYSGTQSAAISLWSNLSNGFSGFFFRGLDTNDLSAFFQTNNNYPDLGPQSMYRPDRAFFLLGDDIDNGLHFSTGSHENASVSFGTNGAGLMANQDIFIKGNTGEVGIQTIDPDIQLSIGDNDTGFVGGGNLTVFANGLGAIKVTENAGSLVTNIWGGSTSVVDPSVPSPDVVIGSGDTVGNFYFLSNAEGLLSQQRGIQINTIANSGQRIYWSDDSHDLRFGTYDNPAFSGGTQDRLWLDGPTSYVGLNINPTAALHLDIPLTTDVGLLVDGVAGASEDLARYAVNGDIKVEIQADGDIYSDERLNFEGQETNLAGVAYGVQMKGKALGTAGSAGISIEPTIAPTANIASAYGTIRLTRPTNYGPTSYNISTLYNVYDRIDLPQGNDIINGILWFGDDSVITGGGTISNLYGVYVDDLTQGTNNNYPIYVKGPTGTSYIGTEVEIGQNLTTTGMNLQGDTWHAFGGFEDVDNTIDLTATTWANVTNSSSNLWTGLETSGISIITDFLRFDNTAHYVGSVVFSASGTTNTDYQIRIIELNTSTVQGYHIGWTGTGLTNFQTVTLPIFINATVGNYYAMQVQNLDNNNDVIFHDSIFEVHYIHS